MRSLTINRLTREGIPFNQGLPETKIKKVRTSTEVGVRLNILCVFIAIADDSRSIKFFTKLLKEQGMYEFLTDTEELILQNEDLTEQEEIDFSWNQESVYALSWCLGIVPKMVEPLYESDLNTIYKFLPPEVDLSKFLHECTLINEQLILQELDYYYNLHWAIRHPESWGAGASKVQKYNISIIRERRKAMEWILDDSLAWDDIPLDT
jgi:hypothetical protein